MTERELGQEIAGIMWDAFLEEDAAASIGLNERSAKNDEALVLAEQAVVNGLASSVDEVFIDANRELVRRMNERCS